jgi:hypothetical protein
MGRDSLCLTIKGKFLTQEFSLHARYYFHLIKVDDRLILTKTSKEETQIPPKRK